MWKLLIPLTLVAVVSGFGASDDRFLKKYAMMKIYESCFGPDVVKEIRREMKAACAKCAAMSIDRTPPPPPPPPAVHHQPQSPYPARYPIQIGPLGNRPPVAELGESVGDHSQNELPIGQIVPINVPNGNVLQDRPNIDFAKLQQAIMATYYQQPIQEPVQQVPDIRFGYPQMVNPLNSYNPWMPQPIVQQNPYFYPFSPQQIYRNRMSRDMDIRSRLEAITSRASGKVRNVTCVMQELGYLDQNLEPNFEKIAERIDNLPVSNELKSDMQEGLQFCQKFSSCVPETKKENSPLSKELIRPMFFFRCYKHKKLEACVMKDVRDRFSNEEDLDTDTDFRSAARSGKSLKSDANVEDMDDIVGSIYDFLYGNGETDFESML